MYSLPSRLNNAEFRHDSKRTCRTGARTRRVADANQKSSDNRRPDRAALRTFPNTRAHRAALGRELPPFGVWAYADLEAMIRAYAESRPTSADDARRLWEGGQVGHALTRKVWLGPRWFSNPLVSALKIAAHEAFHLLQYELVGERSLGVSSLDEIPPAGPWWLAEGTAEYFAYLAVVEDGATRFAEVRAQWVQSTKASSATLRALATLRGQREILPLTISTLWRRSCCSAAMIRSSCLRTTKRSPAACRGRKRSRQRSAGPSTRLWTSSRRTAADCDRAGSEARRRGEHHDALTLAIGMRT